MRHLFLFLVLAAFAACSGGRGDHRGTTGSTGTNTGQSDERRLPDRDGMVHVPGGWFMMSTGEDANSKRRVYVSGFYIDKTEVSNREYGRFIKAGGYSSRKYWSKEGWAWRERNMVNIPRWWREQRYQVGPDYPDYPVSGISWYEARAFARWRGKRLPTEAEWERASRGDGKRHFPWGNEEVVSGKKFMANFSSYDDGYIYSAPVSSFPQGKSVWGCYNMLGNVWEWVQDSFDDTLSYSRLPVRNPLNTNGDRKLLRGGSWFRRPSVYMRYFRFAAWEGNRNYDDVGFRCADDVKPSDRR